jgi:hypothetical protein
MRPEILEKRGSGPGNPSSRYVTNELPQLRADCSKMCHECLLWETTEGKMLCKLLKPNNKQGLFLCLLRASLLGLLCWAGTLLPEAVTVCYLLKNAQEGAGA